MTQILHPPVSAVPLTHNDHNRQARVDPLLSTSPVTVMANNDGSERNETDHDILSDPESTAMIEIAPPGQGDVIFHVENKRRFLVNSAVLRLASATFAAMFSSRFSEGQNLSYSAPKEVALPEDNAYAIWWLCAVLHHRITRVQAWQLPLDFLTDVVLVIDKYQCSGLIGPWISKLTETFLADDKRTEDLHLPILISWLREDRALFRKATRSYLESGRASSSVSFSLQRPCLDFLPLQLLGKVNLIPSIEISFLCICSLPVRATLPRHSRTSVHAARFCIQTPRR